MERKKVGEIISEAREREGLSQRELAKLTRIRCDKLSKIEEGRGKITPRTLRKLSEHIDINYCELMYMIGYGEEVSPLNYFIKNHYSKLKGKDIDIALKNVSFNTTTNKQTIENFKKIISENNFTNYEKELLNEIIDNLEYENKANKEIIKLLKSYKVLEGKNEKI